MSDIHRDLPFSAEYAKSNRAGCKSCGENIAKDSLRLAVMVQVSRAASQYSVGRFFLHQKSEISNTSL